MFSSSQKQSQYNIYQLTLIKWTLSQLLLSSLSTRKAAVNGYLKRSVKLRKMRHLRENSKKKMVVSIWECMKTSYLNQHIV